MFIYSDPAGYIEIQRGEAWGEATGKTSRCTSCSHDQTEVPSRGTPMPMACDIEEERVHVSNKDRGGHLIYYSTGDIRTCIHMYV